MLFTCFDEVCTTKGVSCSSGLLKLLENLKSPNADGFSVRKVVSSIIDKIEGKDVE